MNSSPRNVNKTLWETMIYYIGQHSNLHTVPAALLYLRIIAAASISLSLRAEVVTRRREGEAETAYASIVPQ